ncbi:MAG: hypothetical protein LUF83_10880 [Alistipes sp.]|nr:hypothetical protein [Alistipes sp.]
MTIQEKLSSFDVEEPRLHVFHEGMFAKLYNESAFLFTRHVRRYKVNVTDCRRGRYYSLGFPFFSLGEVFGENSEWVQTEISEDYRIYGAPALGFDAQEYAAWCAEAERAAAEADGRKAARAAKTAAAAPQAETAAGGVRAVSGILPAACTVDAMRAILADVLRFRLESASPLECMLFLQSVQKRCYGALPESSGI